MGVEIRREIMFCQKCGKEMRDDAKFCTNCGQSRYTSKVGVLTSFINKFKNPIVPIVAVAGLIVVVLLVRFVLFGDGWHGNFYYKNGKKVKNEWVLDKGGWYYMNSDGRHAVLWQKINGEYYYFGPGGRMVVDSWVDGNNYYVDASGKMLRNTVTPDGYLVGADGKYINQNIILIMNKYALIKADKSRYKSVRNSFGGTVNAQYKHDCKVDSNGNLYEYESVSYEIDAYGRMNQTETLTIHYLDGSTKKYGHSGEMAVDVYYEGEAYYTSYSSTAKEEFEKYFGMIDNFHTIYG